MAVLRCAVLFVLVVTAGGCRAGPEQWGPFRGRVVDAETGRPIPGAHVMVLWVREPPNFHYTQRFYDAQEAITDTDGQFEIPRETRLLTAWVVEPQISVFAPDYQMQAPVVSPAGGRRYVDSTVVRMRPLRTRDDKCKHRWTGPLIDVGSAIPRIMDAMRQYAIELNCRPEGP